MSDLAEIIRYLKNYDGREVKLMEVCGTHTASIFKNGIRSLISDKIKLISGPGCPVCVTPAVYIDKVIEYCKKPNHVVLSFGDMLKVPGTKESLSEAKANVGHVELMYSPLDVIEKATLNPGITYIIAAVGFETTVPTYGLIIKNAIEANIKNIKIVTALKTIIPALNWICEIGEDIDAFICPGHASVIIGDAVYEPLAEKYNKPFVVAGFEAEHILVTIYDIIKQLEEGKSKVHNLYKNVVRNSGNEKAKELINRIFEEGPAAWRGLGIINGSGLYLRNEYKEYDGGSFGLDEDKLLNEACRCGEVIIGRINPPDCPLFGKVCTPSKAMGPCMVSSEGSCGIWYRNTVRG